MLSRFPSLSWSQRNARQSRRGRHGVRFVEAFESRTLLSAGQPDPTFGVAGAVSSNLFGINDAAVQADGKVVVVGTKVGRNGVDDFAVTRFNLNGSLDGAFGTGGIDVTPIFLNGNLTPAHATGVAVLPDGKILVAGNVGSGSDEGSPGPVPSQLAAVRYNPDGSVDATFGTAGQAVSNYNPGETNGFGVTSTGGAAVLGNGDIVIEGGFFGVGPNNHGTVLGAFTSQGKVDAAFGLPDVPLAFPTLGPGSIAALSGNRVIVVGSSFEYGSLLDGIGEDQAFAVFNADGSGAFTRTNTYLQPPGGLSTPESAAAFAAAAGPGGSFFTAGGVTETGGDHFTLAKYDADGSIDQTFNGGSSPWGPGTVDTSFNGNDAGQALAVASDGKIVVAGTTVTASGASFALARYTTNGSLDSTFGTAGKAVTAVGGNAAVDKVFVLPGGKVLVAGRGASGIELRRYQGDTPAPVTNSVGGTVFNDANANGRRDGGEAGLAGVKLYLDANNNGRMDAGEATATTDGSGAYAFAGVPAGAYVVRQLLPAGYRQTTPANGWGQHVTVIAGATSSGNDFGDFVNVAAPASISGSVFRDANANGRRDTGETGLGGVTLYIDANNNGRMDATEAVTKTDAAGKYAFAGVTRGATLIIRQVLPAGYRQTAPANGFGQHVTVPAAGQPLTADFADAPLLKPL